jgi:CheY-like chemotaxis protein
MAYGFAKQSGGHIEILSTVGYGTRVNIYLPRAEGMAAANPGSDIKQQPLAGGSETILVVEDEAAVRASTVELLSKLGYLTLQAEDAASALRILRSGAHVDLLFTDVMMPGALSGPELAAKAKECQAGIAVLFASGYADGALVQNGKLDSGVNLLNKPYSGEDLARKVRALLQDQQQSRVRH